MRSRRIHHILGKHQKLTTLALGAMLMASLPVSHAQAGHASATAQNAAQRGTRHGKLALPPTPAWGDIGAWDQPQYYATIQLVDIDGDGRPELIARGPRGILVNHFETATNSWVANHAGPPLSDVAHWDQPQYYTTIQFADIDGDGQAELVARAPTGIQVWHYDPRADRWKMLASGGPFSDSWQNSTGSTHWDQPQYYSTIHVADIDGDGHAELIGRGSDGLHVYHYEKKSHSWSELPSIAELGDANGWDQPRHYSTIHLADVDGRAGAELVARGPDGIHVYHYERGSWSPLPPLTELSDANGWDQPNHYSSIQAADVDGRAGAELIARGPDGVHVYHYERGNWTSLPTLSDLSDANGWDEPQYNRTIQLADVDGRPGAELIARGRDGIRVWHYDPKAECWTRLRTARADIASMSDANGWNLPQHYLTIQAANIDGRPGAELIGRSANGIETWRFSSTDRRATEVTGTPVFPAFPGVQNTYYEYISTQLQHYGSDLRAYYDQLSSQDINSSNGIEAQIGKMVPPTGVSPSDSNWQAVVKQLLTELTYVDTTNQWLRGTQGTREIIQQIFHVTDLNADSIAGKLSNVDPSSVIAANLFSLLTKIAQGVASIAGIPVAPGFASLLSTIFSAAHGNGGAPNLSLAVDQVDGQLATMYTAANTANDQTHDALVTNWSQLQAFAASKVGTVLSDKAFDSIVRAGELSYAAWLWETISPAVWRVNIPYYNVHVNPNRCEYSIQLDYPQDGPTYAFDSNGCGPAWIGIDCGVFTCDSVTEPPVLIAFGGGCPAGIDCRDPVNGPLFLSQVDPFLGQNGWNLPCFDQNDTCTLGSENPAFQAERASKARNAIKRLLSLVRTTVPDQGTQGNLAQHLEAALAVLKDGRPTQRDFAMRALQNFVLQTKAQASCQRDATNTAFLVETAYEIRAQLSDDPPLAVVYTRHSQRQNM